MNDKPEPENTSLEIARITSRWQIFTALIGVSAGIVIALLSNERFFGGQTDVAVCDAIEVAGRYGNGSEWEFEMDLLTGQYESEEQAGLGRLNGNIVAMCDATRFSARIEGRNAAGGPPVLCLFDGVRSGADGRAVSGRFLCDNATPEENAANYWQGSLRLMSDV